MRSNPLQYNSPGSGDLEYCICKENLTKNHIYLCSVLNENHIEDIPKYERIFNGTLKQQKIVINILFSNMEKIERLRNTPVPVLL